MGFDLAHSFIAHWEGGLTDHPSDPGGITNFGVSLRFLKSLGPELGDIDGDGDIDATDIRNLTREDAKRIFKREFWDRLNLDRVDCWTPKCAFVLYDTAVNMGAGYARKLFQQALGGLVVDGIWGPKTWAKIENINNDERIALLMISLREERYRYIVERRPASKVFLNGWLNRINALEKAITKRKTN